MNDIPQIVDFRIADRLLSHEIMFQSFDIPPRHFGFLFRSEHLKDERQVLRDDLPCEFRVMFSEVEGLVADFTAHIHEEDPSCCEIRIGEMEVLKGDPRAGPDALLAHALSGHECLARESVFGVMFAPLEDGHGGVVG